jgi:hypothetical protein
MRWEVESMEVMRNDAWFQSENLNVCEHLQNLGTEGRILVKQALKLKGRCGPQIWDWDQ